jgi:FkbM family methyltransferase
MIPNCVIVKKNETQFLLFDKPDIISNGIRHGSGWEEHLEVISERFLVNTFGGVVLDIGANLGSYSLPLAQKFPNVTFHSFEPQRIIFYQLCSNVLINALQNVVCHNYGISDHNDKFMAIMPDYATETNVGAFSLDEQTRENNYECETKGLMEEIEIRILDDQSFKNVRLIKIDVEGLEMEVLKGALKTIEDNNFPPIIFEAWTYKPWYQNRRKELIKFIESLGYNITTVGENNIAQHNTHPQINFKLDIAKTVK